MPAVRDAPDSRPAEAGQATMLGKALSVLLGLSMMLALAVAAAAWLGGSMGVFGDRLAGAVDGVSRATGTAVARVTVIGLDSDPVLEGRVRASVMVEPGEAMLRADPWAVRDRVSGVPGISGAAVYRLWPDQLMIIALAEAPSASPAPGPAADATIAPSLQPGASARSELAAGELRPLLSAIDGAEPVRARRVEGRRWDVTLQNGTVLRLPPDARAAEAVESLRGLQRRTGFLAARPETIDLRVRGQVVFRRAGDPGNAAPATAAGRS